MSSPPPCPCPLHPRRLEPRYPRVRRAPLLVRPGQIADADQELASDLSAGEHEGALEQLHPFHFVQRMVGGEPSREAAMALAQRGDPPRVLDRRLDLQPVAHNRLVRQQTRALAPAVLRDAVDVETVERATEGLALAQHGQP